MASQTEKASVISTLRACILSCKGGIQINALDRDYRSLVGSHIPYRALGYQSLEAFVENCPDLYCSKGARGEIMVHAELNESSAHITEMVNKQKKSTKPRRAPPPNWSTKWSKPNPSWGVYRPPTSRYSTPARVTPPLSPPPSIKYRSKSPPPTSNKVSAKSPLSITINTENSNSRKVVVDKKGYDDSRDRGIYELPPRFQRTEANMKKGPRFISSTKPEEVQDLREKINKMREQKAQISNEEKTKSKTVENGITSKANIEKTQNDVITRKPFFSTVTPETNDKKKTPLIEPNTSKSAKPRWIRSSSEIEDDLNCTSFVEKLEEYTAEHNWPDPTYKTLARVSRGITYYGCQVKVVGQNYSSYPEETTREEEAQEWAAKKAYHKLIESEQYTLTTMNVTDDTDAIFTRVTEIVNQFSSGVWSSEVVKIYANKYNENLPSNWLNLIVVCDTLSMTSTIDGQVVLYADTRDHASDEISAAELQLRNCEIDSPTDIEAEIVPITEQILPADEWDVFISYLVSSNTIYLRLIGEEYSDKYAAIVNEIESYYCGGYGTVCPPESIEVNSYYIGKLDEDWYRVCVFETSEDGDNVNCHLIDIGECEVFNKSDLYFMERQFCQLQPQAVLCSLAGIDDIEDPELCDKIDELLLGKSFVATVNERNDEKKEYSLTLHDTSVDPNKNLNETILNLIDSMYQPLNLLKDSEIKQVYVSHIKADGNLYVQIQSARLDELMKLSEDLDQELIFRHRVPSCAFLKKDKRYLAKFSVDENYYRAVLHSTPSPKDTEVELLFIDYGNVEKVNITDISELDALSTALYKMHPQAIQVTLHDLKVDETGYKKLKELIPESDPVLIKVCKKEGGAGLPEVEVFKRLLQPDGSWQLISIHSTIIYEQSLAKNNQLRKSIRRKEQTTQSTVARPALSPTESKSRNSKSRVMETVHQRLAAPPIPETNSDFFDVYISLAVSPTNFIVQPLNTVQALGELTEQMTKFYKQNGDEYKVDPEDLVEGGLYAALENGEMHRVTLAVTVSQTVLSVYACDSGDYKIVDMENIRYLDQRFTALPYQAIKAKVHGIRAADVDWPTDTCFYFHRLVVDKKLVSVVKDKMKDPLGKHEFMLSLMLIDTNSEDDINIKQELIKNKIAVADTIPSAPK